MMPSAESGDFLLRRRRSSHGVPETWAVSYGDLITQLLVFFIVLVSSSSVSGAKMQQVQQAIKGVSKTSPVEQIAKDLTSTLQKHGLSDFVNVTADDDGITMVIKDSLLFASGEADIPADGRQKLEPIFAAFKELPNVYGFSIEGHTDDAPIHNTHFESNWHLSAARALAVLALFEEHQIGQDRLSVRAFGDQKPLAPNEDASGQPLPENRRLNRRVVIRVK